MSRLSTCGLCRSIDELDRSNGDGFVVARTQTGYVSIFFAPYFKGHTVFATGEHVAELHELDSEVRALHLDEMARIAEATFRVHHPRKMNYAVLGNGSAPHLHWSLVPRYPDDPEPTKSPWEDEGFWKAVSDPDAQKNYPSATEFEALLTEMRATGVVIKQEYQARRP
jgi:diadenosine tetraphosphate (Ap4A) HIT family hydrolase